MKTSDEIVILTPEVDKLTDKKDLNKDELDAVEFPKEVASKSMKQCA